MTSRTEIECQDCKVVYYAEKIPADLQCTCRSKNFKILQVAE